MTTAGDGETHHQRGSPGRNYRAHTIRNIRYSGILHSALSSSTSYPHEQYKIKKKSRSRKRAQTSRHKHVYIRSHVCFPSFSRDILRVHAKFSYDGVVHTPFRTGVCLRSSPLPKCTPLGGSPHRRATPAFTRTPRHRTHVMRAVAFANGATSREYNETASGRVFVHTATNRARSAATTVF